MKFLYSLLFIFFFSLRSLSNGGYITISSSIPSNITICGASKIFSITINNPSAFNLTGVTLSLTMPGGINYQVGSITNATELSVIPLNAPNFSLANIPALSSIVLTYTASANCSVLNHLSQGLPIENYIKVSYTAGLNSTFDNHTSMSYVVKQPNLSITNITNQSYIGAIGGFFTRCITITNGGSGELSAFSLINTHGSGLQITAATPGTWTNSINTETYLLSGTNFTAIGNGNNLFENGESITICETVSITNCSSVNSSFSAGWGCGSQICQASISTANVIFPNNVPNLVITTIPSANICKGSSYVSPQSMKVINNGLGQALNTKIAIFNSVGGGFNNGLITEIDITSFTIKINNGAFLPLAITTTSANAAFPCLSNNPVGAVSVNLPPINAGDSVVIKWQTKSCCSTGYPNGWEYNATYQSICLNNYVVPNTVAQWYQYLYNPNISNNGSPSSIVSGQTQTFNYQLSGTGFGFPSLADGYLNVTFTVTPCFTYSPNTVHILNYNNTATWTPNSVNQVGNVITAVFNAIPPFTMEQAQILIDLTGNCSSCSSGPGQIEVGLYFSPSAACGCEVFMGSSIFPLNLVCPISCDGLNFIAYSAKRTSYGLADNNDDGLPDAGPVNLSLIKTSRAMYGDIVTTKFVGKIKTNLAHPNWQFCYASSTIANGNNLTSLGGILYIYRANAIFATCNIPSVTAVAPPSTFNYDLSSSALISSGGVAAGFVFLNNDSLVFEPQYKVTTNIGGAILPASTTNTFIVSDIANPTNTINIFSCNSFDGNFSIVGYYFTNYGPDNYALSGCNQQVVSQNYYLSIGPCCSNYAGGNMFPFEYRNWANIDTLKMTLPSGYKLVAATFNDVRTSGTFGGVSSPSYPLSPTSTISGTFEFPVGSYFSGISPTITPSDDGFYGVLTATIEPSCGVLQSTPQYIGYNWIFHPSGFLPAGSANNTSNVPNADLITYSGPSIFLQSALPSITATSNIVVWDISLSNVTSYTSNNTWLSAQPISGITINKVVDVATSATIVPVGGIYQLGTLANGTTNNYKLYGTYTSCAKDSIIIEAGWDCQGYPLSANAYTCISQKLKLTSTPLSPLLVTTVITPATVVNLCDMAEYEVIGTNVQLGSAYSLTVNVNIPPGVSIVPGSSQLAYPIASPYVFIGDPVFVSGTTYQYNISVLSASIGANGLPGILNIGANALKIKFKVTTSCGYTSGSLASFSFFGVSGCGASTGQLVSLSSQLGITGASPPYATNTVLKSTFISPCNNSSILRVSSQNLGGLSFGSTDSVKITLPAGVNYIPASFIGIKNPPLVTIPSISTLNGQQHLAWKLPLGVVPNDSTVFTIGYSGNPNILACNITNFEAKTTSSSALLCTLTGSMCGVQVVTGGDTLPIFTYKSYLALSNVNGYSIPNAPAGETAIINFTINNTGEALNASNNTIINYYNDVNSNGIYNVGDVLITQHTLNIAIPNNGLYAYSYSLNIPSGAGCHLIAMIDTAYNHCSCVPSQIAFSLPLKNTALDTTICSGQTVTIGYNPIAGYAYSWTPTSNLSFSNIANPILTGTNTGLANIINSYVLAVNRNTCISYDTAMVIVKPNPTLNLTPSNYTLCIGSSVNYSITGANSYTWQPTTSLSNSNSANAVATPSNNITYTIVGLGTNGCSSTTLSTLVVNPLPNISTNNSTICAGQNATIAASGAINYTWSPSSSLSSSITASVTANPNVSTIYTITGSDINGCINTTTSGVLVNPLPNLTITSNTLCYGLSAPLSAFGSNATTYTWLPSNSLSSANSASVIASPTVNTTYTIIAASLENCYQTYTTSITVYTLPILSTSDYTICNTNSVNINVTGANNYTWTPAIGLSSTNTASAIANPSSSITYTVIGMTINGCVSSSVSTILVNNLPPLSVTSNTICFGQNSIMSASGATNYTWSPSSSLSSSITPTVTASPSITTVYTITGSDLNNCFKTLTTTLVVNPLPNLTLTSNTLCYGLSAPLFASGSNAATYTWTPSNSLNTANSASVIANPTVNTTYTVIGESLENCFQTFTTSITVYTLPILSTSNNTICNTSSVNINVNGANSYTWLPSNGLNNATNSIVIATPSVSTTYTIVGEDLNGCISSTLSSIKVNPLPNVSISSPTVICKGDSATISVSGATTYTWNTITYSTSQIVNPTVTTFYSVVGTDLNGCKNRDSLTLLVLTQPTLSILGTPTVCLGNKINLTANGGIINYLWNTGDTLKTISISPQSSTTYTVESGTYPCNAFKSYAVTVYTPAAVNSIAQPSTIIYGFTSTLTADTIIGNTNLWFDSNDISCNTCETVIVKPETNTIYTVTITDRNGCLITNTVLVNVDIICGEVFVPTGFSPNNDGINDTWCVYGNCIQILELDVFDRWGGKVFESDDKTNCWNGLRMGVMQNDGVYMYQLTAILANKDKVVKKGNFTLVR